MNYIYSVFKRADYENKSKDLSYYFFNLCSLTFLLFLTPPISTFLYLITADFKLALDIGFVTSVTIPLIYVFSPEFKYLEKMDSYSILKANVVMYSLFLFGLLNVFIFTGAYIILCKYGILPNL
jgi:hypothetical protein